jgi:hypothetical protein
VATLTTRGNEVQPLINHPRNGKSWRMPKPNPNRIHRQHTPDSPPPRKQGERDAPGDHTDWTAIGHREAEAEQRDRDAVPPPAPNAPGGGKRPNPPHADV